ncbi:hypothetical protein [Streptomyces griseocarneus]|uniref:hypothetical protein n=1 Tax=Streptomyces griseocarneus TaxID=51201 RepID=UPI00167D8701|nr:hypothetical protein [Streptomyces griseocarneus]MBZ6476693.1 hypothetical protein [Streptomyces griseocarneus]GHG80376.1 hypothetical protein GCM10018779_61890 [Streptomyces griseocarneus]
MPNFAGTAVPNLPPLPERERPTLQQKLQRRYSLVAPNESRNESEVDETSAGEER